MARILMDKKMNDYTIAARSNNHMDMYKMLFREEKEISKWHMLRARLLNRLLENPFEE